MLVYLPLGPFDTHTLPACNCGDNAMAAAFLEWTPWALVHGLNPLLTTYQYFPHGADLAANTTMPLLGILLAPVTLTAGPVAALNLLLRLAFLASAFSGFWVLRRLTGSAPAAFAGGLLFGFSPYLLGEGQTHANLTFVPLLPLLLLVAIEVLVRQERSARAAGALLGLLAALQYGISSELLAGAAIVALVLVAIAGIVHRRAVRRQLRHAATAAGWALAVFVPLTAYPVALSLFGPEHPNGPPRDPRQLHAISSDLLGPLVPTTRQAIGAGLGGIGSRWVAGNAVENGVYVGLPLLALAAVLVVRRRRDPLVAWGAIAAVVSFVLALGPELRVDGHRTGIPLPEAVLTHVPLLDGMVPVRFFLFGWLGLAVLLAAGLAGEWQAWAAKTTAGGANHARVDPRTARRRAFLLVAAVTAAALVPLLPHLPYPRSPGGRVPYSSYAIPAFFEPGGAVTAIPPGSPVLVYPYSDPAPTAGTVDYDVLWQAIGDERFRLLDGDATRPGPHGAGTEAAPPLVPPALETMLRDAYFGPYAFYGPTDLKTAPFPALTPAVLRDVRAALDRYGVSTVVVDPVGADPGSLVAALRAALGRPPTRTGGVLVWFDVRGDLAHGR